MPVLIALVVVCAVGGAVFGALRGGGRAEVDGPAGAFLGAVIGVLWVAPLALLIWGIGFVVYHSVVGY